MLESKKFTSRNYPRPQSLCDRPHSPSSPILLLAWPVYLCAYTPSPFTTLKDAIGCFNYQPAQLRVCPS